MKTGYQKIKSVNQKLTLFLFQEEALIYSRDTEQVHLLNATGIFIWLQFEEGLNQEQVKKTAINNGCENSSELSALIEELYGLFNSGLIKKSNQNEQEQEKEQEEWLTKITLSSQTIHENDERYRILDCDYTFSFPNERTEKLIKPLLAPFLEAEDLASEVKSLDHTQTRLIKLQIVPETNEHYKIIINGFQFSWLIPENRLLSFLLDRLRKMAFYFSDYYLAAHAAVLAKGESCIMFPARSYAGKSTLSAALLASGYRYLSDEMTVLDKQFQARPIPLGLGLKKGSWTVLQSYLPELANAPEQERWDGVAIKYLPVTYTKGLHEFGLTGLALSKERVTVTHIVFPQYQPLAQARLEAISVPQSLFALYQAGYAQDKNLSEAQLEGMLEHLCKIPVYRFVFDDLHEAINCMESLQ